MAHVMTQMKPFIAGKKGYKGASHWQAIAFVMREMLWRSLDSSWDIVVYRFSSSAGSIWTEVNSSIVRNGATWLWRRSQMKCCSRLIEFKYGA